jgi:hypothetical protein
MHRCNLNLTGIQETVTYPEIPLIAIHGILQKKSRNVRIWQGELKQFEFMLLDGSHTFHVSESTAFLTGFANRELW